MTGRPCRSLVTALLLTALLAWSGHSLAAPLTIDAPQQWAYAQHLEQLRQYKTAAEAYQRFAFFFPNHEHAARALFKAGRAFALAGDPHTAIGTFKQLIARYPEAPEAVEGQFAIARAYLQLNADGQAIVHLQNLIALADSEAVKSRAYYTIGWIYARQTDWLQARTTFNRIPAGHRAPYRLDALDQALAQADQIPSKNPKLAGFLSILPGAGQAYCGRYQDAFAALAVNGALIWAAVEAFDDENYALGGLLSFVEFGFYAGNIYGAVSSAHKYNRRQQENFFNDLERRMRITIGRGPTKEPNLVIGLKVRF